MIQYELKKTNPPAVTDNEDGSSTITVGFLTGPVGTPDSYGMLAGDTINVQIANSGSKTKDQIQAEMLVAINAFIAQKYPST